MHTPTRTRDMPRFRTRTFISAMALPVPFLMSLMVVAFSVGLALTLIAVGIVFLDARNRFSDRSHGSSLPDVLPAISGAFITLVGIVLCYGASTSAGLGSPGIA